MTILPSVIADILAAHPELKAFAEERGDMFSTEQWGAVLSEEIEGFAIYRYVLWRIFNDALPMLIVLMLNPSKATHDRGDRTVDGLMRRARRMGYGGIMVVNCFAYRATDPGDMKRAEDPVGPANDSVIAIILSQDADLLCAWGVNATHREREKEVKCVISSAEARPHTLRLCANGAPEHPLYIPLATGLTPWEVNSPGT